MIRQTFDLKLIYLIYASIEVNSVTLILSFIHMRFKIFPFLFLIAILVIISCSKNNAP